MDVVREDTETVGVTGEDVGRQEQMERYDPLYLPLTGSAEEEDK